MLDGKLTLYYENGQIKEEGYFKNDKQDGKRIWYYEDGSKKTAKNYNIGKIKKKDI